MRNCQLVLHVEDKTIVNFANKDNKTFLLVTISSNMKTTLNTLVSRCKTSMEEACEKSKGRIGPEICIGFYVTSCNCANSYWISTCNVTIGRNALFIDIRRECNIKIK